MTLEHDAQWWRERAEREGDTAVGAGVDGTLLADAFQIETRPCRIHGRQHLHVKACGRCLAPLFNGRCAADASHVIAAQATLGTWATTERWRCANDLEGFGGK